MGKGLKLAARAAPGRATPWLPTHATIVLTGVGVSAVSGRSWPVALAAGVAFSALVWKFAGCWSVRRSFGLANLLTSLRVLLLLMAAAYLLRLSELALLASLSMAFLLDALDGAVARRLGDATEFGAAFDTETDALFVLVLGLALWLRDGVQAWVLIPGVLRYGYVLVLALFPPGVAAVQRPLFGRMAFVSSSVLLLTAKAMPGTAAVVSAAVGVIISCASFGRSFLRAYPGWRRILQIGALSRSSLVQGLASTLMFLAAWSLLNVTLNLRYPSPEPSGWYLLPSLDVTVMLGGLAVIGVLGWRLPWTVRASWVVLLVVLRGLRIGDGIAGQSFGKLFNVYSDLPLVPELVRYAHSTFSPWRFAVAATGLLAAVAFFVFSLDRAIAYAARFFLRRWHVLVFLSVALPFAVASAFIRQDPRYNQRYAGAFGSSILPRLQREVTFLLNVYDHRMQQMQTIGAVQEALRQTPSKLDRLHGANVHVFFVESYGATVINRPFYVRKSLQALRGVERQLEGNGFSSASGRLESATYGGMSWLAHATFLTGVRTDSQLQYDLLAVARPNTMAHFAREAGYKTILVQPNTNRQSRGADFYDFDEDFKSWNFDYAGPPFAWATMPDQYVLDFTRRRVLANRDGPFFTTYVLVSSHAPWSHVPAMVEDWSRIGNGEIYRHLPVHRANTNWPDFSNASEPYLTSILYDLQVLSDYITRFVRDDSLIIVLGDHQPVSELTDDSASWAVPVHVISKNASFIQPFLGRGYVPGMVPGQTSAPMQSFLLDFLRDFSSEPSNAHADRRYGTGF
jgi:hypothetical protein